jgi:HEPN domain-containing protein
VSRTEWWHWCREDCDIAAGTCFAFADLLDFSYGLDDLQAQVPQARTLWHMARDNLSNAAAILPSAFDVDAVLQPICMMVELSLKAALVLKGADPNSFRGRNGHDLTALAVRVSREMPHRDDQLVQGVIAELPPYVASRYAPAGLPRLRVVQLAVAAQFVAASTIRRCTERDAALIMEVAEWPGPRRPFFS